jgi:S-disulfanyl-L-cysteine oxidoreductase SoxD
MKSKLKVHQPTCYLLFHFLVFQFLLFYSSTLSVAAQAAATSVWAGVYTEEQAKRGEVIYYERCGACHGPQLEGGDMTPALLGGVFTSTWNDLPLSDLFERIRITMPLNQPSTLSRQQTADVTAFLLKSNKWPAGQTELPRELEPLKEIQIQALKP